VTMRFVFEETGIAASTEIDRASRLLVLGQDFFQRSQFPDAAAAFSQASDCLHELDGLPAEEIPLPCRAAPLLLSDALFGRSNTPRPPRRWRMGCILFRSGPRRIRIFASTSGTSRFTIC